MPSHSSGGLRTRLTLALGALLTVLLLGGLARLMLVDLSVCLVDTTSGERYGTSTWSMIPFGKECTTTLPSGGTVSSGPGWAPSVWLISLVFLGGALIASIVRADRRATP